MGEGTRIDYQLRMRGVPLRWQSVIEEWEPGRRFVDRQVKGPYRWWNHTHEFETVGDGTLVTDRVQYQLPGGWLGALVGGAWVGRDLRKIFQFRRETIQRVFGGGQTDRVR